MAGGGTQDTVMLSCYIALTLVHSRWRQPACNKYVCINGINYWLIIHESARNNLTKFIAHFTYYWPAYTQCREARLVVVAGVSRRHLSASVMLPASGPAGRRARGGREADTPRRASMVTSH